MGLFQEHFWDFISLPEDRSGISEWEQRKPLLTSVGLGDELTDDFKLALSSAGIDPAEFTRALSCTTEVLYESLYAASDEQRTRQHLLELAGIAESAGAEWPDLSCFSKFEWADRHGWGRRPSDHELEMWRRTGV